MQAGPLPHTRRGHSRGQGSEPAPGPGSLSRPQAGARDWPHASPGGVRVTVPMEPRQPPQATELPGQGGRESGGGGKAGGEPARSPGPGGAPRQTRPKPTARPAQGPHRTSWPLVLQPGGASLSPARPHLRSSAEKRHSRRVGRRQPGRGRQVCLWSGPQERPLCVHQMGRNKESWLRSAGADGSQLHLIHTERGNKSQ